MTKAMATGMLVWAVCGAASGAETAQIRIKLTTNGVESLTYQGVEYCDPSGSGMLGFGDWLGHEGGNLSSPGVMDAKKNREPFRPVPAAVALQGETIIKTYAWGSLTATYTVRDADLYVSATLSNGSTTAIGWWKADLLQLNSRLVFDGNASMPYGYTPNMHWDYRWAMWGGPHDAYETWNFTDPHVYWWVDKAAPFASTPVMVMFADLDPKWQTGVYHVKTDHGEAWPVVASADGDPGGAPQVAPGQTDAAHVVIRFRSRAPDDPAVIEKARLRVEELTRQIAAAEAKVKSAQEELDMGLGGKPAVADAKQTLAARQAEFASAQAERQTAGVGAMPSALEVCADGYEAFGRAFPRTVRWTDRRPIGSFFVAETAKGWATNPNGWFNDHSLDVTTDAGRQAFAKRMLERIDASIGVLKDVGAQGVVWWDVEGARNPQPITYIGDPRVLDPAHPQHDKYAPELDTPVTYNGQQMKLVDACFKKWQDAGLKCGVTIRPQTLVWTAPDDHDPAVVEKTRLRVQALEQQVAAAQAKLKKAQDEPNVVLGDAPPAVRAAEQEIAARQSDLAKFLAAQQTPPRQAGEEKELGDNLCAKATYARERWGCTIFYVDSINEWFGNWGMEKTVKKYPDILLMPEWARTRSYRHSSQFSYTRFTGFYRGVPAEMQACWPDAFCCMGNFDYEKNYDDALYAVKRGNVQVFNCWYPNAIAEKIKQIYQLTGIRHTPYAEDQTVSVPLGGAVQVKLVATDEDGRAVTFRILGPPAHGAITRFDPGAGTATYTPAKGYAGADLFTFKAMDTTGLNSNRGKVTIAVK